MNSSSLRRQALAFQLLLVLCAWFFSTSVMRADLLWNWSYVTTTPLDASFTGGGTLTTGSTPNGDGLYTITAMTGTWTLTASSVTTYTVTGLADVGDPVGQNDNLLSPTPFQLDSAGVTFYTTKPSFGTFNIYLLEDHYTAYCESTTEAQDTVGIFTATVASVPEPATNGILLATLALGAMVMRRGQLSLRNRS